MAETLRGAAEAGRSADHIDSMMDRASEALARTAYFEAERLADRALELARSEGDFERMARIALPLQEARRQRLSLAFDCTRVQIVDAAFGEDPRVEPGCYLVQPPLVGADARRLRLAALRHDIPAAVLCREPRTQLGLCPIVAIGRVTIRARIKSPRMWDEPDLPWFIQALEELGDAAIASVDRGLELDRQIDALLDRLDTVPDHEKLHQALAEACREAARLGIRPGRDRE